MSGLHTCLHVEVLFPFHLEMGLVFDLHWPFFPDDSRSLSFWQHARHCGLEHTPSGNYLKNVYMEIDGTTFSCWLGFRIWLGQKGVWKERTVSEWGKLVVWLGGQQSSLFFLGGTISDPSRCLGIFIKLFCIFSHYHEGLGIFSKGNCLQQRVASVVHFGMRDQVIW